MMAHVAGRRKQVGLSSPSNAQGPGASRIGKVILNPERRPQPHEEVPDIVNAELIRFLGTDPAAPATDEGR